MNNFKKVMCGFVGTAMLIGAQVFAQDAAPVAQKQNEWKPSIEFKLEYASRYMSKGKVCNPDRMIFSDLYIGLKDFYVGAWVANDLTDYNEGSGIAYEPEEWDYYFGYATEISDLPIINSLTIDGSFTYFDYPTRSGWDKSSTEQELAIKLTTGLFLNPGILVAWDYENDMWWAKTFVNYKYPLTQVFENLAFKTGAELLWGNTRFNGGLHDEDDTYKNALTALVWNVEFNYDITENFSCGPFGQVAWALDHDIREAWKDGDGSSCNMLWGFRVIASF